MKKLGHDNKSIRSLYKHINLKHKGNEKDFNKLFRKKLQDNEIPNANVNMPHQEAKDLKMILLVSEVEELKEKVVRRDKSIKDDKSLIESQYKEIKKLKWELEVAQAELSELRDDEKTIDIVENEEVAVGRKSRPDVN